jgi:TetR/AcrR family transcriptional regulator
VSERDGSTTREAIVLAAQRCFADHGYAGTSLNDISAEVGIRRPSLLHHFGSKEALYGEVFERSLSEWLSRVELAVHDVAGGWELLDAVLNASSEFFISNPESVRLIRREAIDGGVNVGMDVASAMQPMFDRAVGFLERQMDLGVFRPMSAKDLLISAYSALFGYFSDAPLIDGVLGEPALGTARVQAHMDHIRDLFRAALQPSA